MSPAAQEIRAWFHEEVKFYTIHHLNNGAQFL